MRMGLWLLTLSLYVAVVAPQLQAATKEGTVLRDALVREV